MSITHQPQQLRQPSKFVSVSNNPNKTPSKEMVLRIFSQIVSGKYHDIKKMLIDEKASLAIYDAQYKTVLHYILENSELTNTEKYDLIKYVIEMKTLIDTPDENGVRPLHLACGQHNIKLIKLLLSKKAEINSKDNNYMSPLHYATMPKSISCKVLPKKELIKSNVQEKPDIQTDKLFEDIFNIFKNDNVVLMYMQHIADIFRNNIPFDNQEEDIREINKALHEILTDKKTVYTKESMDRKLIDLRKKIYDQIKLKTTRTFTSIEIKDDTNTGWGPIHGTETHNILQFANIKEVYDEYMETLTIKTKTNCADLDRNMVNINNACNECNTFLGNVGNVSVNFRKYRAFLGDVGDLLVEHGLSNEENFDCCQFIDDLFNSFIVADKWNNPDIASDFNEIMAVDAYNPNNISLFRAHANPNYGIGNYVTHYLSELMQLITIIRDSVIYLTEQALIYDNDNELQNRVMHITNIQIYLLHAVYILQLLRPMMNKLYRSIEKFVNDMSRHNITKIFDKIFKIIHDDMIDAVRKVPLGRTHSVRIGLTLCNITKSKNLYLCETPDNKRLHILDETVQPPPAPIIINGSFGTPPIPAREICVWDIEDDPENPDAYYNLLNNMSKNPQLLDRLYDTLVQFQNSVNTYIDNFNEYNGLLFIKNYNNNLISLSHLQNNCIFRKMVATKINHLKALPASLDDIMANLTLDMLPAMLSTYIAPVIKDYGYMVEDNKHKIMILESPPFVNNIHNDGLVTNILDPNISLLCQNNGIVIGSMGIIIDEQEIQKNHIQKPYNAVSDTTVLDYHMNIIKNIIIMYFVQEILNNNVNIISDIRDTIHLSIKNDKELMKIIVSIITKITDEIILSTLDNIINVGSSHYLRYLIQLNPPLPPANIFTLLEMGEYVQELYVKPYDKLTIMHNNTITESVFRNAQLPPSTIDFLQIYNAKVDNVNDNTEHRLMNGNEISTTKDTCYVIDDDVVPELIKHGADINSAERSGRTPLDLAVFIQNDNLVDVLLKAGAKSSKAYYACFKELITVIQEAPIFNIERINEIAMKDIMKKQNVENIYSNSILILKMTSYMLIHQLTLHTSIYPNMWDIHNHRNILAMLNILNIGNDFIPLAKLNPDIISKNVSGHLVLNDTLDMERRTLVKEQDVLIRLDNSIRNMQEEITYMKTSGTITMNKFRFDELEDMIQELTIARTRSIDKIKEIETRIKHAENLKGMHNNSVNSQRILTDMKQKGNSQSLCSVYDTLFKQINPSTDDFNEYTVYLELWYRLLTRPDTEYMTDHTQMIGILQTYITQKGVVEPDIFLDAYSSVCGLYEKVLCNFGRNYFELTTYLKKDNIYLNQVFCIMVHVFEHTLSVNFINTIAQLFLQHDTGKKISRKAEDIYKALIDSGFIKNCLTIIPRQIVKTVCKISEHENDTDIALTVTDILNKSIDIINLTAYDSINKKTVEYAKDVIVPFFAQYMETYTAEMHALIVKQIKSLMIQNKLLTMLKLLAEKASIEKQSRRT